MLTDPRLGTTLPTLIASLYDFLRRVVVQQNAMATRVRTGQGSPEGVVSAALGTLYLRTDGSTSTTLYVKTADNGANTGWTAK
jgi:hypothetical protein